MATRKDLSSIFFSKKFYINILISKTSHKASRENLLPFGVIRKSHRGGGDGIHPALVLMGLTFIHPRIIQNGSCLPPSHTS